MPTRNMRASSAVTPARTSSSPACAAAARMAGTPSRNENRAADSRRKPNSIADGDRGAGPRNPRHEGSGLRASNREGLAVTDGALATSPAADPIRKEESQRPHDQRHDGDTGRPQLLFNGRRPQHTHHDDWYRAEGHQPDETAWTGHSRGSARAGTARTMAQEVVPEIRDHRQQRPDVTGDVKRQTQTVRIPSEEHPRQNEMGRTGYGQELGESLHRPEESPPGNIPSAVDRQATGSFDRSSCAIRCPPGPRLDRRRRHPGLGFLPAQQDGDGRGNEDGRVRAADDAHQHGKRETP